ncbi:ScbR family autoregulator-binding transcription factor [Streptomyces sp. NBC_01142]|uniref:ScbR family autoregulator-binding transcription factor n=1 Tax=Streptomyces sp. NBC_01142 TaxID=2975865 RepID=UPI00224F9930|nr:ScbR family autoregulator-binding transcription factor [Streptomyces sp. NBC_01142]MCX4824937.1 ScbR family autoregulator-binding transcription factor [Streptomyces sp. NBC_01142]
MQERSAHTRRKLVHAAAELIAHKGHAATSVDDISAAAGVTKGALYFHFASKTELCSAVLHRGNEMLSELLRDLGAQHPSPLQNLIDSTHWLVHWFHVSPEIRASFRLTREPVGPVPSDFYRAWLTLARTLLRQAGQAGELSSQETELGQETLIAAAVVGLEVMHSTSMRDKDMRAGVTALWVFLLPLLVPPGAEKTYRTAAPAGARLRRRLPEGAPASARMLSAGSREVQ